MLECLKECDITKTASLPDCRYPGLAVWYYDRHTYAPNMPKTALSHSRLRSIHVQTRFILILVLRHIA